jgi:hypothetical protein
MEDPLDPKTMGKIAADGVDNFITASDRVFGNRPRRGDINDALTRAVANAAEARETQEAEEDAVDLAVLTGPRLQAMVRVDAMLRGSPFADAVKADVRAALIKASILPKEAEAFAKIRLARLEQAADAADARCVLEDRK